MNKPTNGEGAAPDGSRKEPNAGEAKMSERLIKHAEASGEKATKLIVRLCQESERAAVVLGAAAVDTNLEALLISQLIPCAQESDELFDNDRPLGSFSAKIALARRMGIMSDGFARALHLVRRIRNEFAHSIDELTLSSGACGNRLTELARLCRENKGFNAMEDALSPIDISAELKTFACCLAAILAEVSWVDAVREKAEGNVRAEFDWETDDPKRAPSDSAP